ncbi:hypothetical protein AV530_018819 [Patagioenas fasciata monilis]|uniref:Uncharacterized protein n=1 Tax=Patagioenas fasciata monilis TaxID=372326 RepID=A0A1V4JJM8_PATFA|nr:hypothetical protein AV530_018819 [Patagioenas fasciata monilis]
MEPLVRTEIMDRRWGSIGKSIRHGFQNHIQGDREVSEAFYVESQDTKKIESQYAIPAMRKQRKNDGKRA